MSEVPRTRMVRVENLQPGDVVTCREGWHVIIWDGACQVASLLPGEAWQNGPEPRGVVLPEVLAGMSRFTEESRDAIAQRMLGMGEHSTVGRGLVTIADEGMTFMSSASDSGVTCYSYHVPERYISTDVLDIARGTLAMLRERAGVLADALEEAGFADYRGHELERLRDGTMTPQEFAAMAEYIAST